MKSSCERDQTYLYLCQIHNQSGESWVFRADSIHCVLMGQQMSAIYMFGLAVCH